MPSERGLNVQMARIFPIFIVLFVVVGLSGQTSNVDQGVSLFKRGQYQQAVDSLKSADDPIGSLYLGLAYEKLDDKAKAKRAFESSMKLAYEDFEGKFQLWQQSHEQETLSHFISDRFIICQAGATAAVGAKKLDSSYFLSSEWRIKANILLQLTALGIDGDEIYSGSEKDVKPIQILDRPKAIMPVGMGGLRKVRFFVVFGGDGSLKLVVPSDGKIDAFTVSALRALNGLTLKPATKDGKPVFSMARFEYVFGPGP